MTSGTTTEWSVSVVIPTFNRADFIADAIESVLAQTLPPNEIIVVDDGSTDHTVDVVSSYGEHVRLLRISNTGVGPSRPRNLGIAAATSRYITLLDSDDFLLPAHLQRRREMYQACPELGLVFNRSYVARRTAQGKTAPVLREEFQILRACCRDQVRDDTYIIPSQAAYSAYCKGNYILTATGTTFPKSVWEEVGHFDDSGSLTTSNDYDFFFRVVARHDIAYISTPLQIYYHHGSNISAANLQNDFKAHRYLNHVRVLERQLGRAPSRADRSILRRRIKQALFGLGYGHREAGEYRHALLSHLKSLCYGGSPLGPIVAILKIPAVWMMHRVRGRRRLLTEGCRSGTRLPLR